MGRSSYFSLFGPVYVSHFSCLWLHKITQKVSRVYLYCLCDFQINWEAVLFESCFHTSDWRLNVWSHSTRAENSSVMSSVSMMSRTCHVSRGCHAEVTWPSLPICLPSLRIEYPAFISQFSRDITLMMSLSWLLIGHTDTVLASHWLFLSDGSSKLTGGRWKQFLCDLKCKQSLGLSGQLSYHTNTIVVKFCR